MREGILIRLYKGIYASISGVKLDLESEEDLTSCRKESRSPNSERASDANFAPKETSNCGSVWLSLAADPCHNFLKPTHASREDMIKMNL